LSGIFKSESFKEEDEVRIVYMPHIEMTDNQINVIGPLTKLDYFYSNGALKPFFEIGLYDFQDTVNSITIGANSKLTILELKRFLLSKGISIENINIPLSSLSYVVR
jgi:hypothetical protein